MAEDRPVPGPAGGRARAAEAEADREPPPLPHHLQTSGVRWLVATVVLVVAALAVFGRGMRGIAVDVTVADTAVVRWLGGIDLPGFQRLLGGMAALSSWWVLNAAS